MRKAAAQQCLVVVVEDEEEMCVIALCTTFQVAVVVVGVCHQSGLTNYHSVCNFGEICLSS